MNDCQIRGCRSLETICSDCGRTVSTATFEYPKWNDVKESPVPKINLLQVLIIDIGLETYLVTYNFDHDLFVDQDYDCRSSEILYWMLAPELPRELNEQKRN